MEGYLKKWLNVFERWQDRYFILNGDILKYCDKKEGVVKGQIHLKVASVMLIPDDPLRIILNTGTTEINLRAPDVASKIQWVNHLTNAQEQIDPQPPRSFAKIHELLTDIWMNQAVFEESLSLLQKTQSSSLVDKISESAYNLKMNVTICTHLLELEKEKLEQMYNQSDHGTQFQSFREINDFDNQSLLSTPTKSCQSEINESDMRLSPLKHNLVTSNPVYQKIKLGGQRSRFKLPSEQCSEKIHIWSFLKDMIGKDLARFSVPIQMNEPLSMLQRLAECLEYWELLKLANQQEDDCLRMCYVMAFAIAGYAGNINRHKKPFNPLLGETYELKNKNFRFISEQVSHHPPISAAHAESRDFEFSVQTEIQSKFTARCMEVHPIGNHHVRLKDHNDYIVFQKCTTKVNNLIFGQMYIEHVGNMNFKNYTNGCEGTLTLREGRKFEVDGSVQLGQSKYLLSGHWNDALYATNIQTGQKTQLWKRIPLSEDAIRYYNFTNFAMNLNHLNQQLLMSLPATDSRLRPDQLAFEHGLLQLASDEKFRLEQKQRSKKGRDHQPQYFNFTVNKITNEACFQYKGNYWNRQSEGLDIF